MTATEALAGLLHYLKAEQYRFVAVTPATHARVIARRAPTALGLRDIFGWNREFREADVSRDVISLLRSADALEARNGKLRSTVRVASLGEDLLLHSGFPTDQADAVFFGPDTYRFARFIEQQLPRMGEAQSLVDMGSGSGAGAIAAARVRDFERVTMVDTNGAALQLARINAAAAGVSVESLQADNIPDGADLIIANPPYMVDAAGRSYRDGGGLLGGQVAADWTGQALKRLNPGGAILLYTGAAYVDGQAPLIAALERLCEAAGARLDISEIDPDVFGEELDQPYYERVERIAAIGAVIRPARARRALPRDSAQGHWRRRPVGHR